MAVSSHGGAKRHGGSPGLSRILRMVMPGKKGGEKGRGGGVERGEKDVERGVLERRRREVLA